MKTLCSVAFLVLAISCARDSVAAENASVRTGPWDVAKLLDAPVKLRWGKSQGLVREVYYESVPLEGKPTRVFAYFAKPEGDGPFPGMLLLHGGGGKAFAQWAEQWAKRGYAALAMDLSGNGPDGKRLPDGGPKMNNDTQFRTFPESSSKAGSVFDMWSYHAVAAVLRGHALLAAQKEVDKDRIGITGISWGGYLTCIVAGIDDRLQVAVPVYGCGYLAVNSCWAAEGQFTKMPEEDRRRWIEAFDPASYLPGVRCPMLFVNGTNDFAYPLDSYQKSFRLVKAPVTLRVTVNMPHGHEPGWAPAEIGAFVDSVLAGGKSLAKVGRPVVAGTSATAGVEGEGVVRGQFHFTSDAGKWQDRKWQTVDAKWEPNERRLTADLPPARPLTFFFTATDDRGLVTSGEYAVVE